MLPTFAPLVVPTLSFGTRSVQNFGQLGSNRSDIEDIQDTHFTVKANIPN